MIFILKKNQFLLKIHNAYIKFHPIATKLLNFTRKKESLIQISNDFCTLQFGCKTRCHCKRNGRDALKMRMCKCFRCICQSSVRLYHIYVCTYFKTLLAHRCTHIHTRAHTLAYRHTHTYKNLWHTFFFHFTLLHHIG